MSKVIKHKWLHWTRVLPILAFAALIVSWIYHPTAALVLAVLTILLIGSIIASVHHAEVIAQKVGGSLRLAGPGRRGHGDRSGEPSSP